MAKILKTYLKHLNPTFYMGGGSSKQPAAPDPANTANAQFKYNQKQSIFDAKQNRYTQNNPLGSISWQNTGTDTNPSWVQNTSLSKPQQGLYDNQLNTQNLQSQDANNFAKQLDPQSAYKADYSGLGQQNQGYAQGAQQQLSQFSNTGNQLDVRNQAQQALMDRMNPSLQQDTQALQTQLMNQGLTPGSEAYQRSMLQDSQRTNDARLAAINASGAEAQRAQQMDFGNQNQIMSNASGLQSMDYGARNQYLGEQGTMQGQANTTKNQDLATLSALMQGSGNVNLPTYGGGTSLNTGSAPDIAGLINSQYQNQVAGANASQSGKNSMLGSGMGALGSIGGAYLGK